MGKMVMLSAKDGDQQAQNYGYKLLNYGLNMVYGRYKLPNYGLNMVYGRYKLLNYGLNMVYGRYKLLNYGLWQI